jgi:hypothetical protein
MDSRIVSLLSVTLAWALKMGLTEEQAVTAQSLAWFYWKTSKKNFPDSVWARWAVRKVRANRDLPGCATSVHDALLLASQGAGMERMLDRSPPPDVQVDHKERYEALLSSLTPTARAVAKLRQQGVSNGQIATALRLSEGRISQIARRIREEWDG